MKITACIRDTNNAYLFTITLPSNVAIRVEPCRKYTSAGMDNTGGKIQRRVLEWAAESLGAPGGRRNR